MVFLEGGGFFLLVAAAAAPFFPTFVVEPLPLVSVLDFAAAAAAAIFTAAFLAAEAGKELMLEREPVEFLEFL